jgi:predicted PurR-regulated permease PerM
MGDIPGWIQAVTTILGIFGALGVFLWKTSNSVSTIVRNQVVWLEDHREMKSKIEAMTASNRSMERAVDRMGVKIEDLEHDIKRLNQVVDQTIMKLVTKQ